MPYNSAILTSIYGRRVGLQTLSSGQTGGSRGPQEFLVGPAAFREEVTTADTTAINLQAHGITRLSSGLSADTTAVFSIDPPIPGVGKTVVWGSTTIGTMGSKIFLKTGVNMQTSNGSSFTVVASSAGAVLNLTGVTTALWAVVNGSTGSGFTYTTST